MRLKKQGGGRWRCHLTPKDYQTVLDHAPHDAARIAMRLGGECGLRVSETVDMHLADIKMASTGEAECMLAVPHGKDTTGKLEGGKYRETYLPWDLHGAILSYAKKQRVSAQEPLLGVVSRTIQNWVKRAGESAAQATGEADYRKVSSHDFRAYFATTLLVREGMSKEVVKAVGGWESDETMKPYIAAPADDIIIDEFKRVGIA